MKHAQPDKPVPAKDVPGQMHMEATLDNENFKPAPVGRTLEECLKDVGAGCSELNGIKRGDAVTLAGRTLTALGVVEGKFQPMVRYYDPATGGGNAWMYGDRWKMLAGAKK